MAAKAEQRSAEALIGCALTGRFQPGQSRARSAPSVGALPTGPVHPYTENPIAATHQNPHETEVVKSALDSYG